ncbi:1,4-alpha-glucan branching enzyme GlgB [Botrimarina colliarenosi]|uniref:1,4-alpha-glucan branching enzyme n=1 Tax=Botrimarina colliarenosi TaxID=2528001 RepID=A0A5C6ALW6_9BACT|nr:alpha-amylase family glycosyl hydrolase [Botrimarina colliarenosi]TWU00640.1 1,4-alpha-glucan branching enzyme GlgB [Botrimarina colliarenosi]
MAPAVLQKPAVDISTQPLGATIVDGGVVFRVWAPHAEKVAVVGDFNRWAETASPLAASKGGVWEAFIENATAGQEYKFAIWNGGQKLERIDPYAREVTNSVGNAVIHNPDFDWEGDDFEPSDRNRLIVYEMHVGTFNRKDGEGVGSFANTIEKLDYLQWLGVNALEIMPCAEFAGDLSWGYNPAHLFAVESAYGGPDALKQLVKEAHRRGIAVLMDVVYNHLGPSDLSLWQFDGWSENGKGGIYFYNDQRSSTPWGDTRPDYGRGEVRQYLFDNAMMWLEDYHMDGLRYDMTLYMRSIDGDESNAIPEGWSMAQWINREIHSRYPHKITIAEDLRNNDAITKPEKWGGANFSAQWDAEFVHPIRAALTAVKDEWRSMEAVRDAMTHRYNYDAFERVVYTESHDEVANGKARVPSEVDPKNPSSWPARKRSLLGMSLALTCPGVPMLFQGQEFLRTGWFDDSRPIDWRRIDEEQGVVHAVRDLARLRLDRDGFTSGLTGQRIEVCHVNNQDKVIVFRRWTDGGPADDTVCVANFSAKAFEGYRFGIVRGGEWKLRFNSDAPFYDNPGEEIPERTAFPDSFATDATPYDGFQQSGAVNLPPYSLLVYSQDAV